MRQSPGPRADPMPPVVLRLNAEAVRSLAASLTAVLDHLQHGAPMPPYEVWNFQDLRISGVMWDIREQLGLEQPYRMGPPNPYGDAMSQATARTLRLDAATARDFHGALYAFGEHYAAGAAIGPVSDDEVIRLEAVLAELVDVEPATK